MMTEYYNNSVNEKRNKIMCGYPKFPENYLQVERKVTQIAVNT